MQPRLRQGFVAGFLGAIILIVIMAIMQLAMGSPPGFVNIYNATIGGGGPTTSWIIGAILFAISGGIWGFIYAALVSRSTVGKGMAFGILPTLWLWLVVAPVIGQPVFFGFAPRQLIMPFIFNVVIWGAFIGWYCSRPVASRTSTPPSKPSKTS